MTHGILDYSLIRSMLIACDKSFIIEHTDDEESFNHFITIIIDIMENENYILTSDELIRKVEDVIYHYRSLYLKNKEINDKINFIISKLNQYKNMNFSERKMLSDEWLHNERIDRGLPESCENFKYVFSLIYFDKEIIIILYGLHNKEVKLYEEFEYVVWLSLINLAINRFPDDFKTFNQEILKSQLNIFKWIIGFSITTKKIIRNTSLNLKKFNKEHEKIKNLELK